MYVSSLVLFLAFQYFWWTDKEVDIERERERERERESSSSRSVSPYVKCINVFINVYLSVCLSIYHASIEKKTSSSGH